MGEPDGTDRARAVRERRVGGFGGRPAMSHSAFVLRTREGALETETLRGGRSV